MLHRRATEVHLDPPILVSRPGFIATHHERNGRSWRRQRIRRPRDPLALYLTPSGRALPHRRRTRRNPLQRQEILDTLDSCPYSDHARPPWYFPVMAANLTFRLEGGQDLSRSVRAAVANTRNLTPVWNAISDDFRELQREQFDRGGPQSRKWRRNEPRWRRRKDGRPVGIYRGTLERSLTSRGRGHVDRRGLDTIVLGSRLPHAHLFAATRPLITVVNRQVGKDWADLVAETIGAPILDGGSVRAVRSRRRRRRSPRR